MQIKLIALDIDGTILNRQGELVPENRHTLKTLAKRNLIIVLSSGRMTPRIYPFTRQLGIDAVVVSYNGAMIHARKRENRYLIWHRPLPKTYSQFIINFARKENVHFNFYTNDTLYAIDNPEYAKFRKIYSTQTGAKYHLVSDLHRFYATAPTKLILITDPKRREVLYDYFLPRLGDKVTILKTNPEYLEFMQRNVNKGTALERVARYYHIPREEVIAFGDGDNDAEMLAWAGVGVALLNATATAKQSAKYVTTQDCDYAGVSRFLTQLLKL